ncbi:MAG TPA: hypothetical protein DD473_08250 [Planctomycetaceae bacterium]|nr:hypothetical protein [Planctomycetaceae bacterium]
MPELLNGKSTSGFQLFQKKVQINFRSKTIEMLFLVFGVTLQEGIPSQLVTITTVLQRDAQWRFRL